MGETDPLSKARWIVEAALDLKAERPVILDMRELTSYADTFVILTGRSDRQVRGIATSIVEALKARDDAPLGVEGLDDGNWVLIDCNDAIVHVFDPDTRVKYDLERLWRDAPRLDLGIPGVDPDPTQLLGDDRSSVDAPDSLEDEFDADAIDASDELEDEDAEIANRRSRGRGVRG